MTREAILLMMADILEGLRRSGMAESGKALTEDDVLIGTRLILDSIGLVTFIAEVEDRINENRDEPIELILTDIWEFKSETPSLTVGMLADYCAKITA